MAVRCIFFEQAGFRQILCRFVFRRTDGKICNRDIWNSQGAAYTLTPFRIDTLVVGALITVAVRDLAARQVLTKYAVWPLLFAATFLAFVFAVHDGVWFADRWMHTIGFSVLAVGWGGLLVMCLPGYGSGS